MPGAPAPATLPRCGLGSCCFHPLPPSTPFQLSFSCPRIIRVRPHEVRALDTFIKLVRAAGSVIARTSRPLASSGLTVGQFGVLETLLHLGPIHQCDLARKHLQSGGNITMIVDNLEKAGLVRRARLPEDRRYVQVHLTDAGRERIEEIFPRQARNITEQMSVLTASEQEELARLCRKLGLGVTSREASACGNDPVVLGDGVPRHRRGGPLRSAPLVFQSTAPMHRFFGPFFTGRAAFGVLIIRVFFGWGLVLHGYQKWTHGGPFHWGRPVGHSRLLAEHGLSGASSPAAWGLMVGLLTPLAALGITITMCVAFLKVHIPAHEVYVHMEGGPKLRGRRALPHRRRRRAHQRARRAVARLAYFRQAGAPQSLRALNPCHARRGFDRQPALQRHRFCRAGVSPRSRAG